MAIFNYMDRDGGELEILDQGSDLLFLVADADSSSDSVQLKRDDVIRLHTALGAWISGDNVPVCDPDSLYGQLIRQAVHEELARVIPECLAQTQAPANLDVCRGGYGCEVLDYHAPYSPGCGRPDPDPEPHDVGHPTYEDARPLFAPGAKEYYQKVLGITPAEDARPLVRVGPSHCGECTHPMNDHIAFGGCWGNAGTCACEVQQDAPVPVVESDKVWGEAGQPPVHCTCGHPAADHTGGICWGMAPMQEREGASGCRCEYAPSAPPVRCTCEHDRQMHGRFGCRVLGCACKWAVASGRAWGEQGQAPTACVGCGHAKALHTYSGGCGECDSHGVECACRRGPR